MAIPQADGHLLLAPLGGVGVIGMNNMLLGYQDDLVLLDCGVLFADHHQPGADLVLPSLDVLDRVAERLRGIVLTHGHEDHLGAVPHVASRYGLPVWATGFTRALLKEKARANGFAPLDLRPLEPGATVRFGELAITPLRVTHSLPDCVSLAIRSPVGTVVFTGDWKRDPGLPCGTRFDDAGFAKLGEEGVLALLSDSTNVEVAGHTDSEADVAVGLREAIGACEGRVFVGLFSSNLYRVHAVLTAAKASGRKVAVIGRSIHRYLDACRAWGGLDLPEDVLINVRNLDRYQDDELLLMCTGSQGEPRAALTRIAAGSHPQVHIRRGDTLLMSARKIPGNEKAVWALLDAFARQGARVVHRNDPHLIHASGHAARDELRWMVETLRPRYFLPVHGTWTFLQQHAALARACGAKAPLIMESGDVVALDQQGPRKLGEFEPTPWLSDGKRVGRPETLGVPDRLEMAQNGAVAVTALVGRGAARVRVQPRGLYDDGGELVRSLEDELSPWLDQLLRGGLDDDSVEEELAAYVRRSYRRAIDRRPIVFAQLVRG
jgi:ribonuclease J